MEIGGIGSLLTRKQPVFTPSMERDALCVHFARKLMNLGRGGADVEITGGVLSFYLHAHMNYT